MVGGDTGAVSAAGGDTGGRIFDCMRDAVDAYSHFNAYTYAYTHIHTHACADVRSNTYANAHTHSHSHSHIHPHACADIRSNTYANTHTHAYTHIHTHSNSDPNPNIMGVRVPASSKLDPNTHAVAVTYTYSRGDRRHRPCSSDHPLGRESSGQLSCQSGEQTH